MLDIRIKTIPNDQQRYPTTGDWWYERGGRLSVRVSDMDHADGDYFEALVGIHEAVEALICRADGVTDDQVVAFDTLYEEARSQITAERPLPDAENSAKFNFSMFWSKVAEFEEKYGGSELITADSEPGDHPSAPYHKQHGYATAVERMLCAALGLYWSEYEQVVAQTGGEGH